MQRHSSTRWALAAPLLLLASACTDRHVLAPEEIPGPTAELARIDCRANVAQGTLSCSSAVPQTPGVSADLVTMGVQNFNVKLASFGTSYDAGTEIFRSNLTVQSLIAEVMGVDNTNTVTGVRVYHGVGPNTTGGTGVVTVQNADGMDILLGSNQPYFLYSQALAPYEISAAKEWRWNVPSTVLTFDFTLWVQAEVVNGQASLFDALWDGSLSTAWDSAANWTNNLAPTATDVVSIPVGTFPNLPLLGGNTTIAGLHVGTGSTLGLETYRLEVTGNVSAGGTINNGTVRMSGAGTVLDGNVNALEVTGSVKLQGATKATGAVSVQDGALTVADQALSISIP
jgi:hypothetical protein